ncbi:MAG: ABC transporter permease [Defluviitaleaceae bacterium]|nr:ABC transporter permease [Defluviitaleaceae bacterium]
MQFLNEIKHDKFAIISAITLAIILPGVFIGAPIVARFYDVMRVEPTVLPISPAMSGTILGLDEMGRNQLHLLIIAARNSFFLAFCVTFFSFALGLCVGIFSGFYGGKVDHVIMRVTDTWSMLPFLMVVVVLLSVFGKTVFNFILFFSLFTWVFRARLIRAAALSLRESEFIAASKTLGTPNIVIIFRELLPNLTDVVVANFVLTLAANIGIETGLSLLGFGLGYDFPSLGVMLQNAVNPFYLQYFWWTWVPPLALVVIMMLCINFLGNALQRTSRSQAH